MDFWYGIAGNVLGTVNVITKGVVGVTVMMWIRWTLPRLRIDQVITVCLKYCVPIAAVMFLWCNGVAVLPAEPHVFWHHRSAAVHRAACRSAATQLKQNRPQKQSPHPRQAANPSVATIAQHS